MFENSISKGKQEELFGDGMKSDQKLKSKEATRQWRNPRIVRVSRSLGGKDRHSKVCTIRGLRDRRIRLSVPTAIQLYDLQHKLGLTQPSKVVDWLLDVTKSDIDKLPPLDHFFSHNNYNQQQTLLLPPLGTSFSLGVNHHQNLKSIDSTARLKGKEADSTSKCWWMKTNIEEQNQGAHIGSNALAYSYNNNSYSMEPPPNSSLSLSHQFRSQGNLLDSHHHHQNPSSGSAMQFSSSSQLLFCPSSSATSSSLFTHQQVPIFMYNSMESEPRQSNNHIHQFLNSITTTTTTTQSQHMPPHAFNIPPLGGHPIAPFSSKLLLNSDHHMGSDRS